MSTGFLRLGINRDGPAGHRNKAAARHVFIATMEYEHSL